MKILVVVEMSADEPAFDSLALLSDISSLKANISVLVCGHDIANAAPRLGAAGATHVLVADHRQFLNPLIAPRVALIERLCTEHRFDGVFFSASTIATDVAGALSARLEAGLHWGLNAITIRDGALVGTRLGRDDTMLVEVRWNSPVAVAVFRPSTTEPLLSDHRADQIEFVEPDDVPGRLHFVDRTLIAQGTGPSLSEALIVVSAGRGIGSRDKLALVEALADALGGVMGVSLPLVDMGWAPRSRQVGQTGIVIKPTLYVACGISGQFQHRLGMERSRHIIAINTDPGAPIMQFCDLAVLADVQTVLPELTAAIRKRTAG